jgi:hypothetical protein
MTNKTKVQKGGFPANGKQFLLRVWARILWTVSPLLKRIKKVNKKRKVNKMQNKTQAQKFVESRSATFQYAIDVLALAFILALIFTFINHIAK